MPCVKGINPDALVQMQLWDAVPYHMLEKDGGASRDRTDDLIVANDALSQLSYSPVPGLPARKTLREPEWILTVYQNREIG